MRGEGRRGKRGKGGVEGGGEKRERGDGNCRKEKGKGIEMGKWRGELKEEGERGG